MATPAERPQLCEQVAVALRGEDTVELEARKGYMVAPLSERDVLDVFPLQGDIAAGLAARVTEPSSASGG